MARKTSSPDGNERNRAAPVSRKPSAETVNDSEPSGPREVIEQAGRDIERGLVDTDERGIPSDVPGPRRKTGSGADVPPGGGNRSSYSERRRAPRIDSAPPPGAQKPTRQR